MPQITLQSQEDCPAGYAIRDWCYKAKVDVHWEQQDLTAPRVVLANGTNLVNPTIAALAEAVGFRVEPRRRQYDVVVVGAGPAGLSAAIYAGSEGLETCLIEKYHPGGQAGSTSFIENMLGYADGVSGCDFAADAIRHVARFPKIDLVTPLSVTMIGPTRQGFNLFLSNGAYIWTKTVVIATGVSYRYLDVARFSGSDRLKSVTLRSVVHKTRVKTTTEAVFIFIGGRPHSEWLHDFVETSPDGYILGNHGSTYATSEPGVFAIGDVRYGSLKRVVTAAGEGAAVVNEVHRYLAVPV
jgi:thioredoxin reductase